MANDPSSLFTIDGTVYGPGGIRRPGIRLVAVDLVDDQQTQPKVLVSTTSDASARFSLQLSAEQVLRLFRIGRDEEGGEVARPLASRTRHLAIVAYSNAAVVGRLDLPITLDGLAKGYDIELHTTQAGESTAMHTGNHQVSGVVRDQAGLPVAGYRVELLHRQLRSEPLVTHTQSGSDGSFRLSYSPTPLLGDDGRAFAIVVRALEPVGNAWEERVRSERICPTPRTLELALTIPGAADTRTEIEKVASLVDPRVGGLEWSELTDDDAELIACETGLPLSQVLLYIRANRLAESANLAVEPFYALGALGMTMSVAAIGAVKPTVLRQTLDTAVARQIVPPWADVGAVVAQLASTMGARAVADDDDAPLGQLLAAAGLLPGLRESFLTGYVGRTGTVAEFWQSFASTRTPEEVADVRFALHACALVNDHLPLVTELQQRRVAGQLSTPRDLAALGFADWEAIIKGTGVQPGTGAPANYPGATQAERETLYATALTRAAEEAFPTAAIVQRVAKTGRWGLAATYVAAQPTLDFRTTNARQYLASNPPVGLTTQEQESLRQQLSEAQRLFMVAPRFDRDQVAGTLLDAGIHSAQQIAAMGPSSFIETHGAALGQDVAKVVFDNAHHVVATLTTLALKSSAALNPFSLPAGGGGKVATGGDAPPDLEGLLGPLDYCACAHCRSVLSPAAYLVDLLRFLEQRPALEDEDPVGPAQAPFAALVARRADLLHTRLDCANTNTPLPAIDLVNEILEREVAGVTPTQWPQTTRTEGELRAQPEHRLDAAYDVLRTAVYPWSLPFDLARAETEAFLGHLGVTRHQLLTVCGEPSATLEDAIAQARLGLTETAAQIVAGGGTQLLHELWGLTAGEWPDALDSAQAFLEQAQLDFSGFQALAATNYAGGGGQLQIDFATPCQLEGATMVGLQTTRLSRIHRFLRLQRALGWTMAETDAAIVALGTGGGDPLSMACLRAIARLLALHERFSSLPRRELMAWFSDLSITAPSAGERSHYEAVFVEITAQGDPSPLAVGQPIVALSTVMPRLAAALSRTEDDVARIMALDPSRSTTTVANLSWLYRWSSLARALGLGIDETIALVQLTGIVPFSVLGAGALDAVEELVRIHDAIAKARVPVLELDALLRHQGREPSGISAAAIAAVLVELVRGLQAVRSELAVALEASRTRLSVLIEQVARLLSPIDAVPLLKKVQDIPEQTPAVLEPRPDALHWLDLDLWNALQQVPPAGDPLLSIEHRASLVLAQLIDHLRQKLMEGVVIRKLGEAFELSAAATRLLLDPPLPDLPRLALFVEPAHGFVDAIDFAQQADALTDPALPEWLENGGGGFDALAGQFAAIRWLAKAAALVRQLRLGDDDLRWLASRATTYGLLSPAALVTVPVGGASSLLGPWLALQRWATFGREHTDGIGALRGILDRTDPLLRRAALATATGWEEAAIVDVAEQRGIDLTAPTITIDALWQLADAFVLARTLGVTATRVCSWAVVAPTTAIARDIQAAAKARVPAERWPAVIEPLRDGLRQRQRDALVARVLAVDPDARTPEDLFGRLLIDTQVSPCAKTSRIKQALASVQTFVQRVQLNLEPGVNLSASASAEWQWMSRYRVWEANRKIFLWPENWLQPELRDDKTELFEAFEDVLLEREVSEASAEAAVTEYVRQLDGIARLHVAGMYHERELGPEETLVVDRLHVFARTRAKPFRWFYRVRVDDSYWTPWEAVPLQIDAESVVPAVFRRKLVVAWCTYQARSKSESEAPPHDYHEIRLMWSVLDQGKWGSVHAAETTSNDLGISLSFVPAPDMGFDPGIVWLRVEYPSRFFFTSFIAKTGELVIAPGFEVAEPSPGYFVYPPRFILSGIDSEPRVFILNAADRLRFSFTSMDSPWWLARPLGMTPRQQWYVRDDNKYSKNELAALGLQVPARLESTGEFVQYKLLSKPRPGYTVAASMQYPGFACRSPFVYQDRERSLLVVPRHSVGTTDYAIPSDGGSGDAPVMEVLGGWSHAALLPLKNSPAGGGAASEWGELESSDLATQPIAPATSAAFGPFESWTFELSAFSHPLAGRVVDVLRRHGVAGIYRPPEDGEWSQLRRQLWRNNVHALYDQTDAVTSGAIVDEIDFASSGAYSVYNWELFFHIPMFIALRLAEDKKFAEAREWMHYVFDPTEGGNSPTPARYWKVKPLFESEVSDVAEQLEALQYAGDDATKIKRRNETLDEIARWRKNPFRPHALARLRVSAYQRWVVMRYLDNLLEWGDHLFRQDTIESNNEALQLYVMAAQLLGPRPTVLPAQEAAGMTYADVQGSIDAFSNFLAQAENAIPAATALTKNRLALAKMAVAGFDLPPLQVPSKASLSELPRPTTTTFSMMQLIGFAIAAPTVPGEPQEATPRLYFCVPHNEVFLRYWDVVEDRLFKLRHCLDIEGVARQLPLFEPPIDPGLLAQAIAAGVDLSSALSDIGAPLPHYRFGTMLGLAKELAAEVRGFGSAVAEALRNADAEALAELRAAQESKLLARLRHVRVQRIEEAEEAVRSIRAAMDVLHHRRSHYDGLANSKYLVKEGSQLAKLEQAKEVMYQANLAEALATYLSLIPQFEFGTSGNGIHMSTGFGGQQLATVTRIFAQLLQTDANWLQTSATISGIEAGYDRRKQDWEFQRDQAGKELERLEQDLAGANIRIAISKRELTDHDAQTANAQAVDEYLRERYTNAELYRWLGSELSRSYFQAYQIAFEIAKQAQRCYRYELGIPDASFIEFGYWDNRHKGLLAGERLLHDLRRMETSYLANNRREYELTKKISVARIDPFALLDLQRSGECYVNVPEALYELDHPSHYMRRLRSVRLSVVGTTGPFDAVPVTLTLVGSKVRTSATNHADPLVEETGGATQSIATSSGQSDAGLFEANLRDERYLPFEGKGAVSNWKLELPKVLRSFDYGAIVDVVLEVQYTAREGGAAFAGQVLGPNGAGLRGRLDAMGLGSGDYGTGRMWGWSVRARFPEVWAAFRQPATGQPHRAELVLGAEHYPRPLSGSGLEVLEVYVVLVGGAVTASTTISVGWPGSTSPATPTLNGTLFPGLLIASTTLVADTNAFGTWTVELDASAVSQPFTDLMLVVRYTEG